jgi:hypothetical protein
MKTTMTFTMAGHLSECVLLAYRTPAESVKHLVPPPLELLTNQQWAFWNIVLCRIDRMRPAGFPRFTGLSYHHVAYRLYVQARTRAEVITGLYFVRSDADSRVVTRLGNLLSAFHFHPGKIDFRIESCKFLVDAF